MISIIVPVYNAGQYIERCYRSICDQTYKDYEIIFVNDGSTDNSLDLLQTFEQQDTRLKIINHPSNQGITAARQTGIKNVTGDYITFLDVDDAFTPHALQQMLDPFINPEVDIVVGGYAIIKNGRQIYQEILPFSNDVTSHVYLKYIYTHPRWELWGKLYRKNLFNTSLHFVAGIMAGEDLLLNTQLQLRARKVGFTSTICYHYYKGHTSLTVTSSDKYAVDVIKATMAVRDIFVANSLEKKFKDELDALFLLAYSTSVRRGSLKRNSVYRKEIGIHFTKKALQLIGVQKATYVVIAYLGGKNIRKVLQKLVNKYY
ncbi:MAG: glycosyltransferase [Tannerellaceae bacterium]|nr:glycosyltransferase [Tannerellaceae bacterium]